MKRGQIKQIFVWLLTLVVAVAIIFYGMKVIRGSERLKDDVLVVNFFSDLDKKLSQYYYLDKGSSGRERFTLPSNVQYVCFTNATGRLSDTAPFLKGIGRADYSIVKSLRDLSEDNVFVGPMDLYEENRYKLDSKISLREDRIIDCASVSGGILSLSLENEGIKKGVQIK